MRKPFLIALIITFLGAISWGMYSSKTNPLDYLFEIGVVLMGLGISILWQMKIFFLKPEHKKSFSNWLKKPNKKFVTLLMRDEDQQFPFIVPLNWLAKGLIIFGLVLGIKYGIFCCSQLLKEPSERLLVLGFGIWLGAFLGAYIYGIGDKKSELALKIMPQIAQWKINPVFVNEKENPKLHEAIAFYFLDQTSSVVKAVSFICFLVGLFLKLLI